VSLPHGEGAAAWKYNDVTGSYTKPYIGRKRERTQEDDEEDEEEDDEEAAGRTTQKTKSWRGRQRTKRTHRQD